MEDNRSVIERLEDIEEELKKKQDSFRETKPKSSINSQIEDSFEEYFKTSKVYVYEPDGRKFRKYKKEQLKGIYILCLIYLIPLVIHALLSIFNKCFLTFLYIGDILLLCVPLFMLVYAIKQKNKKLANSKWNMKNIKFYIFDNKLEEERSKGLIYMLFNILKIVTFIGFIASIIPYVVNDTMDGALFVIHIFVSCVLVSFHFIIKSKDYWYNYYIFDNKDSYVISEGGYNWEKHLK